MAKVLDTCSTIEVPTNQTAAPVEHVVLPPVAPVAPVAPAPAVEAAPAPPAVEPAAPAPVPLVQVPAPAPAAYYQNCSAVRAAGAAPIRVGDPGFQSKFDRDGDGVGCE
ncbi:excalibur calcium-binding domain-containing protein [Arthrobacter alpinus]|nr:excalibur calcium-binding domain-containing protein [Arthrobacter alpinus]